MVSFSFSAKRVQDLSEKMDTKNDFSPITVGSMEANEDEMANQGDSYGHSKKVILFPPM